MYRLLDQAFSEACRPNESRFGVERVSYLFDHKKTKEWLPLYAVTRRAGVISDRPYLISAERYHGFSLGGRATFVEKIDEPEEKGPAG